MTIAMSFSMTTEQVGYFVIYIYYPAMTLHIAVTRRNYYYTTRASVYISGLRYFSMPTYHGKSKILVCRHILYLGRHILCHGRHILYPGRHILCPGQHILYPGQHILYLRSQVFLFLSTSGY
jgi:hypothetical protein